MDGVGVIGEDRMVEGDQSFDKNFSGAVVSGGGGSNFSSCPLELLIKCV